MSKTVSDRISTSRVFTSAASERGSSDSEGVVILSQLFVDAQLTTLDGVTSVRVSVDYTTRDKALELAPIASIDAMTLDEARSLRDQLSAVLGQLPFGTR